MQLSVDISMNFRHTFLLTDKSNKQKAGSKKQL
ncbi:MAG: hypothetical protein UZ10_BCD003002133 [Bacteroidetes bacterium OLB10]|nr:MAG: hypothetical protein UZ10_BCD003002133 [Bacteroidetes bacterium OLB10]